MILTSGEPAQLTRIPRTEAIRFLSKRIATRDAFGFKIKTSRHRRGPGAAVDIINYGLQIEGKTRACLRIGPAPFGNQPIISALGRDLAPHGAYLMRLAGVGISGQDLEAFVAGCLLRFRADFPERDYRYLLSLDDPHGWLIEAQTIFEAPAYAGKIYQAVGALSAGFSKTRRQPTRWVDPEGCLHSIYQSGKNILSELPEGARLVKAGPKQRYVFVLASPGSIEYHAWRQALPAHVVELERAEVGWVQPRLLIDWLQGEWVPI